MSNPIGINTTLWANEHYRQPNLRLIRVGEHETPTPYIIKPLEWVYNANHGNWECPTVFGRLHLWTEHQTGKWNLNLPSFTSSHNTRMEALQAAWVWYVNELKLKCIRVVPDEPDCTDDLDARTGMTEDERRNIG